MIMRKECGVVCMYKNFWNGRQVCMVAGNGEGCFAVVAEWGWGG
jgi:hypothetical protein